MAVLTVKVRPGAKRSEVAGVVDGAWQIRIAAPALEGKATASLLKYLAETLSVPKSTVSIRHGERSRVKVVEIVGLTQAEADARLRQAIEA